MTKLIKRKAKRNLQPPSPGRAKKGFGYEMPPARGQVYIYFDQKGMAGQAQAFYDHCDKAYWRSAQGTPYRNWKVLASDWIFNYQQEQKLKRRQWENRLA